METTDRKPSGHWSPGWLIAGLLGWTLLIVALVGREVQRDHRTTERIALLDAREHFSKDLAFHAWAMHNGGVYMPTNEQTQPEPFLLHVTERDVVTPSGRTLTLANPVRMLQQVRGWFPNQQEVLSHLTSLQPSLPESTGDAWETNALRRLAAGANEVVAFTPLNGAPYLRLMRPLITQPACAKCHADDAPGGAMRGGLSVALPMAELQAVERAHLADTAGAFGLIWLLGVAGLGGAGWWSHRRSAERQRAEAGLRASEDRFRTLVDYTYDWETMAGPDGAFQYVSPSCRRITGYDADEFERDAGLFLRIVHPEDQATVHQHAELVDREGPPGEMDFRIVTRSGEIRWINHVCQAVFTAEGRCLGRRASNRDITDRKQTWQLLRESEARLVEAQRIARVGSWERDLKTGRVWWSPEMYRLFGLPVEAATPTHEQALDAVHPDDRSRVADAVAEAIATKRDYRLEYRLRGADGVERFVTAQGRVVPDATGQPARTCGVTQDITERRRAEVALRESESRYRSLVENSADTIGIYQDEKLVFINSAGARLIGAASPAELLDQRVEHLVHPDEIAAGLDRLRRCLAGERGIYPVESRYLRLDGTPVPVEITVSLTEFRNRPAFQFIARDIRDRKRNEAALHASLREKEVLLKEIHHRVKNNLQLVSSLLNLQAAQAENPFVQSALQVTRNRIGTMALLHESLYQIGDLARFEFPVFLEHLAAQVLRSGQETGGRVRVRCQADRVQLELGQAIPCALLVNELLTNSLKHAFPNGRSGEIGLTFHCTETGQIRLRVTDNGVGLPPGLDPARASSLGLQLVSDLTTQLRGQLKVERAAGTTVEITFPLRTSN